MCTREINKMTFLTTIICKAKDLQRWKARHRLFSWPSYGKWVEEIHQDKSQFVPFTDKPYERKDGDPKIFAYYLTQFHAIPENDELMAKALRNGPMWLPHNRILLDITNRRYLTI